MMNTSIAAIPLGTAGELRPRPLRMDGSRVLLVAPRFMRYDQEIRREIESRGANVDLLPDRPFDTPVMTALTRLRPAWIMPAVDRLYHRLLQGLGASHYDFIVVVNGQTMSPRTLAMLRGSYPRAKTVLYMWDSIANRRNGRAILAQFDRACSFDPQDSKNYGMALRPLFYAKVFGEARPDEPPRYHISFVGTAHTDRYAVVDRMRRTLSSDIRAYWYLYLQAPWVLHTYRLVKPAVRAARRDEFRFTPLDRKSVQAVFAQSHAVLDIEHPRQRGLTMRTFETLGCAKKLVTTNAGVRDYDFYSPDNICVIDRQAPVVARKFLDTAFEPLSPQIRYRYSIEGWLDEVLELGSRDAPEQLAGDDTRRPR